jgi:hypothetical protein
MGSLKLQQEVGKVAQTIFVNTNAIKPQSRIFLLSEEFRKELCRR